MKILREVVLILTAGILVVIIFVSGVDDPVFLLISIILGLMCAVGLFFFFKWRYERKKPKKIK